MMTSSVVASGRWWRRPEFSKVVPVLLLGQFLSFILALLTFTSSFSASLGLNSPVTLGLFGYLALTMVYGSILLYRRHELVIPWYWYALIAFFDVQGNYLCSAIFERKTLEAVTWSAELILTFVGNTVGFLLFYTLTPLILQASGATLFNLSLLTSDMWAVVIRIFFYQQQVEWLYYVSFAVVGVGLLIYSKTEKSPNLSQEPENGIPNPQYQLVHEQASIDV